MGWSMSEEENVFRGEEAEPGMVGMMTRAGPSFWWIPWVLMHSWCQLKKKKHNLKVKNYVSFGGLLEDFKPRHSISGSSK